MTKNPNPGLLMFSFLVLCEVGGGEGGGLTGQGEVLVREWEQFIFICDPLFQHNTHCLCFHEDIPKGYRV